MDDRFLRIYMNDQLAAGVVWRQLAQRSQGRNKATDLGGALAEVSAAITEDVATFEQMMERLGFRRNPIKVGLALAGERVGRLKLNGRVGSYSPLSRFVELESLVMGIEGKKVLWTTMRDLAGLATRLPDVDFDHLIDRAQWQRDRLEPFRVAAGRHVLNMATAEPSAAGPALQT